MGEAGHLVHGGGSSELTILRKLLCNNLQTRLHEGWRDLRCLASFTETWLQGETKLSISKTNLSILKENLATRKQLPMYFYEESCPTTKLLKMLIHLFSGTSFLTGSTEQR